MIDYGQLEIEQAIRERRSVVALETAVLTHGLPWPINLQTVQRMESVVRKTGAIPATIGLIDGRVVVGLNEAQLHRLAESDDVHKAGARDIAVLSVHGASAGTTVGGTLAICRAVGIRVFATGGIGGVHRGWIHSGDISGDLHELAQTPCCVVSSGAKAILDLPATLEMLETLGIPVIGYQTDAFPQFYSCGSADDLPVPHRADDLKTVADLCRVHWDQLGQARGVLLANPIPVESSIPQDEVERAVKTALRDAEEHGIRGSEVTPYLLEAVSRLTGDRTRQANLALLESNAQVAAQLAVLMASESET